MRFARITHEGQDGVALFEDEALHGLPHDDSAFPGDLPDLIARGPEALEAAAAVLRRGHRVAPDTAVFRPVVGNGKVICIGTNFPGHVKETGAEVPAHPTFFARFATSLIGHRAPILRPTVSHELDYEGELTVVIGRGGRSIPHADALDHVAGYTLANDGTLRDFQFETSQWTMGKNFDGTGALGPYFVTADEVPAGGRNLVLETRVNGVVVQRASTSDMIYDVAACIAFISQGITLQPGDAIMMGTPEGIGFKRTPQLFLKPGDLVEVEIERIGLLANTVADGG